MVTKIDELELSGYELDFKYALTDKLRIDGAYGYTDGEIKEIDTQISYEKNVGIIPDPNAQLLMRPRQPGMGGEIQGDMNMAAQGAGPEGDMDFGGGAPADPGINMGGMGGAVGGGGMGGGASTMPS